MATQKLIPGCFFAFCCTAGLALQVAHADITVEERMAVTGSGLMSVANMSGRSVTSISGNRARMETDVQMQSRLARMFVRDAGQSTQIIRLDEDKVYDLNAKKKQYTETSVTEQRAKLEKAMEQAKQAQQQQPSPTGMDESQCEWSDPKVDVKKTGAKGNFAGFSAEQTTIVASQSCKDRKTGAVCDVALYLDEWLAPGFDGGTEAQKFYQAYAQKMGLAGSGSRDFAQRAESLFSRYQGVWQQIAKEMRNVKGYPVRSTIAMGFGGPQCQNTQQAQSGASGSQPAGTPGSMAEQIGGRIAGSLFGRKKQAESAGAGGSQPAEEPLPAAMNGMITPLRITSELVSVSKDALGATTFDVPPDFKKVDTAN